MISLLLSPNMVCLHRHHILSLTGITIQRWKDDDFKLLIATTIQTTQPQTISWSSMSMDGLRSRHLMNNWYSCSSPDCWKSTPKLIPVPSKATLVRCSGQFRTFGSYLEGIVNSINVPSDYFDYCVRGSLDALLYLLYSTRGSWLKSIRFARCIFLVIFPQVPSTVMHSNLSSVNILKVLVLASHNDASGNLMILFTDFAHYGRL